MDFEARNQSRAQGAKKGHFRPSDTVGELVRRTKEDRERLRVLVRDYLEDISSATLGEIRDAISISSMLTDTAFRHVLLGMDDIMVEPRRTAESRVNYYSLKCESASLEVTAVHESTELPDTTLDEEAAEYWASVEAEEAASDE